MATWLERMAWDLEFAGRAERTRVAWGRQFILLQGARHPKGGEVEKMYPRVGRGNFSPPRSGMRHP